MVALNLILNIANNLNILILNIIGSVAVNLIFNIMDNLYNLVPNLIIPNLIPNLIPSLVVLNLIFSLSANLIVIIEAIYLYLPLIKTNFNNNNV